MMEEQGSQCYARFCLNGNSLTETKITQYLYLIPLIKTVEKKNCCNNDV